MIKRQFIEKQVRKSVRTKCTSLFLRRLVFQTVDTVARTHYGHDYAMKCLQTAAASRMLLEEVGIESRLTAGAVCVPKILTNGQFGGWTGYWGDHHHVWLETEFNEVADLALSQLHEHPGTSVSEMQTPAIWWNQKNGWPPIIRYLFDSPFGSVSLSDTEEQASYERFLASVREAFSSTMANRSVGDVVFSPLLGDVEELNVWIEKRHPWAIGALSVVSRRIPMPEWVADREREVKLALSQGKCPKSRLSDRDDLFGINDVV